MSMSVNERCKIYKEAQSTIKKLLENGSKLDKNIYMNQIASIKKDVTSTDENERKAAVEMLNFLITLNVEEIEAELIKLLHDNSTNKLTKNVILKSIKQKVVDMISGNMNNLTNILLPWKHQNINQLTNIIEDVCVSDLPKDTLKIFFINHIIPTMMATDTNNDVRDSCMDIAFMLSTIFPISDLSQDELQLFMKDVNTKYVINIGHLRDKDYPNWHNLWIFLVRFCDKHIHYSMELTNKLLRVVEFAFRNSTIQQRLKGYDCWKELIDNASLDMNHMCSPKQIKLLITPLKAKFSKQEVVICKRFDVFTYLLEKLQHKAVLCLTEFFEFCFGPVGDNKDASKTGQGKSVPQIWTKSTKVLLEIIGHSHGKNGSCLLTDEVIKLEKPVINYTNIASYYKVIINSVGECCALLKEIDIDSKRETAIQCMWKSLFNLIIPTSETNRGRYFQLVSTVLDNYLSQSRENPYFGDLLIQIFSILMSYDEQFVCEVIEFVLRQVLTVLFTVGDFPSTVADRFTTMITHWLAGIMTSDVKLKGLKEIMLVITKTRPLEENIVYVGKMWLCLANELIMDITGEEIFLVDEFNDFFMWPAYRLHHLDDGSKKQVVLRWMKLYRKFTTNDDSKKLIVLKDLEKMFKTNPLLNPNIVSLLNIMSQFESKFSKEFVLNIMIVTSQILQLPNLKTEQEQKIIALVMQYFEPSLECYKADVSDDLIKSICTCIEHILCIHKSYQLLDTFSTFMKNSTPPLKIKFSKYISTLLLDLVNKESDTNGKNFKELQKVLKVLHTDNTKKEESASPFLPPSRSARIAHMAKNSPRSPQRRLKNIEPSPTALRLFGKDLDTLSPLQVKGSQLNNITPKSRKIVNTKTTPRKTPSINDEKSSDFIPINTEVKLQPEKLSRHQKEMLKKRREDIPALYQDLSQSLSQDLFSSSSSLKDSDKDDNSRGKKVVVELIGDQLKPIVEKVSVDISSNIITDFNVPNSVSQSLPNTEVSPEAVKHTSAESSAPNIELIPEANLASDEILPAEIVSEQVVVAVDEIIVPNDDLTSQVVKNDKIIDPEETVIEEHKDTIIESNCTDPKPKDSIDVENCPQIEKQKETLEKKTQEAEVVIDDKESAKSEVEDKQKRRKQKIESELQKLKMDIVGAEEFLAASRRTRTREKPKKLEDFSNKTPKTPVKEEKQATRKSLNVEAPESKEPIVEKNRRKTIGSVDETRSSTENKLGPTENKTNHPETPKSRRKRSSKAKLDDTVKINSTDSKPIDNVDKTPKRGKIKKELHEDATAGTNETGRGQKRKHSSVDDESEDIIESSQQFHSDLTPVFNSSKKRSLIDISCPEEKLDKSTEKTLAEQKTVTKEDFLPEIEQVSNEVVIDDVGTVDGEPADVITKNDDENVEIAQDDAEELDNKMDETVDKEADVTQDTTVTQESTQDITQTEEADSQTEDTETQRSGTQDTVTEDTQTQTEVSVASEDIRPPVLYFDLPKKPELTESERMMCRMDTMSICLDPKNLPIKIDSEEHSEADLPLRPESPIGSSKLSMEMEDVLSTPKSNTSSDLPSSPVTVETPNRTSELLSNTLDISPINSKNSSDDGESENQGPQISINFKAEMAELDLIEKDQLASENKSQFQNLEKPFNNLENEEVPVLLGDVLTHLGDIPNQVEGAVYQNEEFLKMERILFPTEENLEHIDMVSSENDIGEIEETQNQPEELSSHDTSDKKIDTPYIEGAKPGKDSINERASRLLNLVSVNSPMSHKLFMRKRNVTMSPSTARIKRLMSNFNQKQSLEDIVSDVKEEDLLTFSREVPSPLAVPRSSILKRKMSDSSESDGVSPCPKRKRVNFSDPCLTSKKLFIKDDYNREVEANSTNTPHERDSSEESADLSTPVEPVNSEAATETENIETEPSLEMTNPLLLKKDRPIYPKLVDCKENVILILKRVTSPMFITTLMNKLKSKEIKTIGDLAKQSEAEINRFPFKVPVVPNVYKALDNYYKKNIDKFAKEESETSPKVNGTEENKRQGVIKKTSKKIDVKLEFRQLIEKSKGEGSFEELLKIVLSTVEKQHILSLVKNHYHLEITDFLSQTDYKTVLKHITQQIGLPTIFQMISGNINNPEEESVYYDCVMKQSLEKRSLSNLWENRSLDDIRTGLEESISRNVFTRQEVVDRCLVPLIENPTNISNYVNNLTMVQLSDVVVQRLRNEDLTEFFGKILDSCSNDYSVTLSKEVLLRIESPSDVITVFKDCVEAQSEDKRNEVMVEMFKYISGKLDVSMLLGLHVDFLKRIPTLMVSSEK